MASSRLPGQALDVSIVLNGDGVAGKESELVLEDAGIPVASAWHRWNSDRDRWEAHLQYLAPSAAGGRLRVRVAPLAGEATADDNVADVAVPPVRGPLRTLVVEAPVTWPAVFVRRALEGESAFSVSSLQRAGKSVATRTGGPPPGNGDSPRFQRQKTDLALLARASGGRVFPAARLSDLTAALKAAYPARPVVYSVRIMRSPWWCVPFAALLCVEWTLRRRRDPA